MTKNQIKAIMTLAVIIIGLLLWSASAAKSQNWRSVDVGIDFAILKDSIWVVKIDQKESQFYVRGHQDMFRTLPDWSKWAGAAINLNMYKPEGMPNGYFKLKGAILQPELANYNAFIVWNEQEMKILDRTVHSMQEINSWPNISQNIRMITPHGDRIRWKEKTKRWSASTLATDKEGNILFIHVRKGMNMRKLSHILLASNLGIQNMVYLEGGPEASIAVYGYFSRPLRRKKERMGSYETGFNENDNNNEFWPLPWVLCVMRR